MGEQQERMGATGIWVLPNPSGLNAHFQAAELGRMFREMRERAEETEE
jgi:TDG/mug DNA glycosylase family protein